MFLPPLIGLCFDHLYVLLGQTCCLELFLIQTRTHNHSSAWDVGKNKSSVISQQRLGILFL